MGREPKVTVFDHFEEIQLLDTSKLSNRIALAWGCRSAGELRYKAFHLTLVAILFIGFISGLLLIRAELVKNDAEFIRYCSIQKFNKTAMMYNWSLNWNSTKELL